MTKTPKSVLDYLEGLTWDGTPRIDRWLVEYAGAEDSSYVRAVSRAALVAAVRRARHPGCRLDQMLVIQGPQGCEKSSALRALAVDPDWFTDDAPISGSSQAIIEATHGKWIVELSELNGMGAGDIAALKAFLSARDDVPKRQAYQRVPERVPRAFLVVGTTSATDYLQDPTGNRRFWPVRVERFDVERLSADRDQLWAEAAAAEAAGDEIRVPDRDVPEQADTAPVDLRERLLGFLMKEWSRKDSRQLVAVDLLYSPGHGYRDEEVRRWERADEPEFFAEPANVEQLAATIVRVAEEEADNRTGRQRFVVRAHQHAGTKNVMSFSVVPAYYGSDGSDGEARDDRAAYVVVSDGSGVEFSSPSIDAACAYVSEKLRKQADETALVNPSSYRIKRVPSA